jgi:hypothetical protein
MDEFIDSALASSDVMEGVDSVLIVNDRHASCIARIYSANSKVFLSFLTKHKRRRQATNQQNDRPGTPATSQLPTHMR